jgi:hypothetical protein
MLRNRLATICILGATVGSALPLKAQAFIPEIAFGTQKVKDLLGDATAKANELLNNGERTSNRVLADAGVKMNVLIQNLRFAMEDNLDTAFNKLNESQQAAFTEINVVIRSANDLLKKGQQIEDNTDIDLNRTLDRVTQLLIKSRPFYLKRVEGLHQTHQLLDYHVKLVGKGFDLQDTAPPTSATLAAFINGQKIDDGLLRRGSNNETTITIPFQKLNTFFGADGIKTAWLFVRTTYAKQGLNPFKDNPRFDLNLPITLLPITAATVDISAISQRVSWDALPTENSTYEYFVGGFGNGSMNFWSQTETFNDRLRVSAVKVDSKEPNCGWCYNHDGTRPLSTPENSYILDNVNHKIVFKVACNGNPCHNRWIVTFQKMGTTNVVQVIEKAKRISYDEFSFDIPSDAADWLGACPSNIQRA